MFKRLSLKQTKSKLFLEGESPSLQEKTLASRKFLKVMSGIAFPKSFHRNEF